MLTISPAVRIYLATGATDLRRSIDGLAAVVRDRFALEPTSGVDARAQSGPWRPRGRPREP